MTSIFLHVFPPVGYIEASETYQVTLTVHELPVSTINLHNSTTLHLLYEVHDWATS